MDELESFHRVLGDISKGIPSDEVQKFLVEAYVRGAANGADDVQFEGSASVFSKRRYRDAWNRTVMRRGSKKHNHSMKATTYSDLLFHVCEAHFKVLFIFACF